MTGRGLYIRRWVNGAGGLMALWLLMLLPARAAESKSITERQTFVTCASSQHGVDDGDFSTPVFSQESMALLSTSTGVSFPHSPASLPVIQASFYRPLSRDVSGQLQDFSCLFLFRRSLIEHQISINAP